MPQDQFQALIDAIRSIKLSGKSAYDYVVLVVPVITGILGWLLTSLWQNRQFRQNSRKEHYYLAVQKVELLTGKYTSFLMYVQATFDSIRACLNTGRIVADDDLVTYITKYETMLAEVYHLQRLAFPGRRFDRKPLTIAAKEIERLFQDTIQLSIQLKQVGRGSPPDDQMTVQVQMAGKKFHSDLTSALVKLTAEVTKIEIEMENILDARAKPLGLLYK